MSSIDAARLGRRGHPVGPLLERRQGVCDGDGSTRRGEKGVVVLGVADADGVVRREPQLRQRRSRPVALLTPDGSTITAPLLKMTCSSSPRSRITSSTAVSCGSQVATMTWPTESGRCRAARSASTNSSAAARRARRAAVGGRVEQRAVLGDDALEELDCGKDREQLVELAAGDEHELAACLLEFFQRLGRLVVYCAIRKSKRSRSPPRGRCNARDTCHAASAAAASRPGS